MSSDKLMATVMGAMLPLAEEKLKKEHEQRIKILQKIIMDQEENKDFFKSPSAYFVSHGALSIKSIDLPGYGLIDLIDDDTTAKYIRQLRVRVAEGKSLIDLKEVADSTIVRNYAVYDTKTLWTHTDYWTKTKGKGFTPDDLDDLDFGPLVSPDSVTRFKKYLRSNLSK